MLSNKKYGLTMNLVSTRVLPVLVPHLVNPQLDIDNYTLIHSTVQNMLDHVDRHQRNKLKIEGLLHYSLIKTLAIKLWCHFQLQPVFVGYKILSKLIIYDCRPS